MSERNPNNIQPNILFISADQLGAAFLGCYGSGVTSTPNLDTLAASGIRFDRAYPVCPVCAPNRASWLTGRSPAVHGVITNNYALPENSITHAHILQRYGYRTGGFGKFHQTPMHWETPASVDFLGFDESVVHEDMKWSPWLNWVQERCPEQADIALAMTWTPHDRDIPKSLRKEREAAIAKHIRPLQKDSPWSLMHPSPLREDLHDSVYLADLGIEFMQRHQEAHPEQPFFCHVSFVDPHDPYDPPAPFDTMFHPDDMKDPLPAEWIEQGPQALDAHRDDYMHFRDICDAPAAIRQLRALFHGSLAHLDREIGRLLSSLNEMGVADNTIVVFTTDHGDHMGDHGVVSKGEKHYDAGIRVPLIVRGPEMKTGTSGRLTSSLDLFPTLCDWAGIPTEEFPPLEGRSLAPECRGKSGVDPWSDIACCFMSTVSIISDDGWRLTRYLDEGEGQMFNLFEDPAEQSNRYNDPACSEKRMELQERLLVHLNAANRLAHSRNLPHKDRTCYALSNKGGTVDYRNIGGKPAPAFRAFPDQ